jgi:hypothetical protein
MENINYVQFLLLLFNFLQSQHKSNNNLIY